MTSQFDPNQFLDQSTDTAASRRLPLTAGADYSAQLGVPSVRTVQGKKDPSKSYTFLEIPVTVDLTTNPKERERVGQDSVNLRYSTSLDITDGGQLDWAPGRNNGLRFLREATGQNVAGKSFSIRALEGRMVRVKIGHEEYPEGSGEMQDRVVGVAKP